MSANRGSAFLLVTRGLASSARGGEGTVACHHHYHYHPHACLPDAEADVWDRQRGAYGQQEGSR